MKDVEVTMVSQQDGILNHGQVGIEQPNTEKHEAAYMAV